MKFWITEGGGMVNFGTAFPCDEHRAATAVTQTFKVAQTYDALRDPLIRLQLDRQQLPGLRSGLTRADGSLREGYSSFAKALKRFR